jgi:hypothetical protein
VARTSRVSRNYYSQGEMTPLLAGVIFCGEMYFKWHDGVRKWLGTGQAYPSDGYVRVGTLETKVREDVHSVCAAPGNFQP